MFWRYVLSFLLWWWVWYLVFYVRFAQREIVSDLRRHLKWAQKELQHISSELDEHMQQNYLLKEKMTEMITTNNDLNKVVGQLSRYYYHIKVWAEKVLELAEFLKLPDESIEDKMKRFLPTDTKSQIKTHLSINDDNKSF